MQRREKGAHSGCSKHEGGRLVAMLTAPGEDVGRRCNDEVVVAEGAAKKKEKGENCRLEKGKTRRKVVFWPTWDPNFFILRP